VIGLLIPVAQLLEKILVIYFLVIRHQLSGGRVAQNLLHQEEQADGKIIEVWGEKPNSTTSFSSNLCFLLLSLLLQEEDF
jgi:hypothetical protein